MQLAELDVVRRDVGLSPLPATAWALAVQAGPKALSERTTEEVEAAALATKLADEMLAADAFIFRFRSTITRFRNTLRRELTFWSPNRV